MELVAKSRGSNTPTTIEETHHTICLKNPLTNALSHFKLEVIRDQKIDEQKITYLWSATHNAEDELVVDQHTIQE